MATKCRSLTQNELPQSTDDDRRELFEACRNGDLNKVKKIVNTHNVNAKDTAGRKSSPLHFAAGEVHECDLTTSSNKTRIFVLVDVHFGFSRISSCFCFFGFHLLRRIVY